LPRTPQRPPPVRRYATWRPPVPSVRRRVPDPDRPHCRGWPAWSRPPRPVRRRVPDPTGRPPTGPPAPLGVPRSSPVPSPTRRAPPVAAAGLPAVGDVSWRGGTDRGAVAGQAQPGGVPGLAARRHGTAVERRVRDHRRQGDVPLP